MIPLSPSLLIADPMVALELLAIVLTISYLLKLIWSESRSTVGVTEENWREKSDIYSRFSTCSVRLGSTFEVGRLISLPKESLRDQRRISLEKAI